MIKITDIVAAVNRLLKNRYTDCKTYGHEVIEGYDKPSFFVDIGSRSISNESINFQKCAYTIMITYFTDKSGQDKSLDNLKKIDEIKELFGYKLAINDRFINVTDFGYDFVGEFTDTLQLSIEIEFFDTVERNTDTTTANTMNLTVEKR
jgi:hypothetical protein